MTSRLDSGNRCLVIKLSWVKLHDVECESATLLRQVIAAIIRPSSPADMLLKVLGARINASPPLHEKALFWIQVLVTLLTLPIMQEIDL